MPLGDYLSVEVICPDLKAQERDDAIREILQKLVKAKALPRSLMEPAFNAVLEREKLGSTAIGKGIAVPHARLDKLKKFALGFAYSRAGVAFNALDGEAVHHVFLILAPNEGAEEYLRIMQRITRLVQNADFRRFVARASGSQEILDLILEMDK